MVVAGTVVMAVRAPWPVPVAGGGAGAKRAHGTEKNHTDEEDKPSRLCVRKA